MSRHVSAFDVVAWFDRGMPCEPGCPWEVAVGYCGGLHSNFLTWGWEAANERTLVPPALGVRDGQTLASEDTCDTGKDGDLPSHPAWA